MASPALIETGRAACLAERSARLWPSLAAYQTSLGRRLGVPRAIPRLWRASLRRRALRAFCGASSAARRNFSMPTEGGRLTARRYELPKHVGVVPMVMPEGELVQI